MFDPKDLTEKIFANKVRNNFPTADVKFEFGRLQEEVGELKIALDQGNKKEIAGELADVAIFSMAITKMERFDAEILFVNADIEHSFIRTTNFQRLERKVKNLKKALEGDDEDHEDIFVALIELVSELAAMAEMNGIELTVAIEEKVAYNATRIYKRA